jgi:hypothetical protein
MAKKNEEIIEDKVIEKKIEKVIDESEDKKVSVKFKNTYIGSLGVFYKNNRYDIINKLSEKLKNDIVEE